MLNEKMEQQRRLEEEALTQFSVKMTELTNNFHTARTFYICKCSDDIMCDFMLVEHLSSYFPLKKVMSTVLRLCCYIMTADGASVNVTVGELY